jgi:hypothetical protein
VKVSYRFAYGFLLIPPGTALLLQWPPAVFIVHTLRVREWFVHLWVLTYIDKIKRHGSIKNLSVNNIRSYRDLAKHDDSGG